MVSAEASLRELSIQLQQAPRPFGAYVEAVRTGDLLFLTGMLPVENQKPKFVGRIGKELDDAIGREAAQLAALNALAVARERLGSLDKVTRIVRLGVYIATSGDLVDQPRVADGASELFNKVFGPDKMSARLVIGVARLPMDMPVELEVILEAKS
jgi:enamine deaminase RidA (YjgF/YER057c/UK114 family)